MAIYEHELPPDVVPVSEPILVQSTSEDIISPEEDPLVSSPPFTRGLSSQSDPNISTGSLQGASPVSAPRQDSVSEPIESLTQTFELPIPISILPTSPEAALSPVGLAPIAPITPEELMTLAQLPPPPSYDVPNRVVDQSPMMELSGFNFGSPLSSSSSTYPERAFTPSTLSNDYFTRRARSHTFSHPSSAHHHPHLYHHHYESQVQVQQDETLPQTPRYSLEFPSHIPHELHLQQYQQARASSFMVSSPSSSSSSSTAFSTPRLDSQSPHVLQSRSFSQPGYYPTFGASSDSLENGRRARQSPAGPRGRSSTLGESSKLLIQRMQSLWRKTGASSAMPSSAALAVFNDVPQGLGLSLGNDSSMASLSRQQHVEDVVVVVVPQDEEEEEEEEVLVASSSASTLTPENEDEEEDKESTTSEEDAPRASSSTNMSSLSLESQMPMPMAIPLAV